jgi:hypothetical protein
MQPVTASMIRLGDILPVYVQIFLTFIGLIYLARLPSPGLPFNIQG